MILLLTLRELQPELPATAHGEAGEDLHQGPEEVHQPGALPDQSGWPGVRGRPEAAAHGSRPGELWPRLGEGQRSMW